MGVAVSGS